MITEELRAQYPLLANFLPAWFGDGDNVDTAVAEFKSRPAEMVQRDDIVAEGYRLLAADEASVKQMMEWSNLSFPDHTAACDWLTRVLDKLAD